MASSKVAWPKRPLERSAALWRTPAVRQGAWLLLATVLAGTLDYAANATMGRMLGPADYGIYAVLLSLYLTLGALAGVIQTAMTNQTARMSQDRDLPALRGLARAALRWLVLAGAIVGAAMVLGNGPLSKILQISAPEPVWVLAAAMIPLALSPLGLGLLRGLQKFGVLGGTTVLMAGLRLVSGLVLVYLGAGVTGAVASFAFRSLAVVVMAVLFLPAIWRNWREASAPRVDTLKAPLFYTALGSLSYALLTGMDILVVKSRFSPVDSGLYASISAVGKVTLWIAIPLLTLLLPKAAGKHVRGDDSTTLLRGTQLAALVLCGALALLFHGFSGPIMHLLYGHQYVAQAQLLGPYGLVMALYALAGVWFIYYLGIDRMAYMWVLAVGVVVQMVVLVLVCQTFHQIVWTMMAVGVGLTVTGEILYRYSTRQGRSLR